MSNASPLFSIIIPACNRPVLLNNCLDSLSRMNCTKNAFEVVVVDDGSDEPLASVVKKYGQNLDLAFVSQPRSGPAAARNKGASYARGKFLVFLDDDCTVKADYLATIEDCISKKGDCAFAGLMVNVFTANPYSTTTQILVDYLHSYYNSGNNGVRFLTSNSLIVPAEEFREMGGFDEDFPVPAAEDRDLCERWSLNGNKIVLAPELKVFHANWLRFRDFFKQHFNYGRGAFRFHRKRAVREKKPTYLCLEGASFYFRLLIYPFSVRFLKAKPLIFILIVVSQIATFIGFFWEKIQSSGKLACHT